MNASTRVRDVMSGRPTTLGRNDRLTIADDLMKDQRIRHLPVLDENGRLAGIVSQRDLFHGALLRALGYGTVARDRALDSLVVKEVMTTDVQVTTPETLISDAARVMIERKIGCLPVVEDGRLVGILTEGDFVQMAARGA